MLTGLKVSSLVRNVYFTDQNLMKRRDPMELKLSFRNSKLKCING